ncbi:60S ribosomal protein L24 [Terramyces sp. JEL0728]|nr:60S ribosomal protein L24 [Terramyces sp. JEL0728]
MTKFKFKGANFMKKKIGNTHPKDLIKTQRIFPGDLVQVVSGKTDVGKQGKVLEAVKHMKPNPFYPKGAKITKETPIHYSNVQLVDPILNKPTKVRFEMVHNPIKETTEYTRLALESREYLPIPKKEDKFKKQDEGPHDTPVDLVEKITWTPKLDVCPFPNSLMNELERMKRKNKESAAF